MSNKVSRWVLEFIDRITAPMREVQDSIDKTASSTKELGKDLSEASEKTANFSQVAAEFGAKMFLFNQAAEGISRFSGAIKDVITPGVEFETSLAELSVITQKSGAELEAIGDSAKSLAEEFGGSSSQQVQAFTGVIGSLGDQFGDSSEALEIMGRNVATLSKLMGGDAVAASEALTTAMLQYGVDLDNPIEAARTATEMMNTMQAAANVGASEVRDTSEALRQSGLLAKQSGLSFEELNASLEGLAKGKIVAGEAGTAMRNILLAMNTIGGATDDTLNRLKDYGVDIDKVSDPTVKFTDRLRELAKIKDDKYLPADLFGKPNVAAGQTLLENIDTIDEWTDAVRGTTAATDGAKVMMETYAEKIARVNAQVENYKIGLFEAVEPVAPFITLTGDAISSVGQFGVAVWGLSFLFKKDLYVGMFSGIKALGSWIATTKVATDVNWLLNLSLWSNPITWVVGGVMLAVGAFTILWKKVEGFRAVMTGLWEVIKTFGKLLKDFIIDRIVGFIKGIGALGKSIAALFSGNFKEAWQHAKEGVAGIVGVDAVKNAYNGAKSIGENFQKGYNDGVEAFQKANKKVDLNTVVMTPNFMPGQEAIFGNAGSGQNGYTPWAGADMDMTTVNFMPIPSSSVGAKSVAGGGSKNASNSNKSNGKSKGDSSDKELGLSGGGSGGGGKSVVMNLTINNHLNGVKNPDEFVDIVVRKINDRLSDALAVAM